MSTSITTTTKSEELHEEKTSRYQQLVQKKAALEKQLNEKYEQLHQLCQKVNCVNIRLHKRKEFSMLNKPKNDEIIIPSSYIHIYCLNDLVIIQKYFRFHFISFLHFFLSLILYFLGG